MNKTELVKEMARSFGVTQKDSANFLDALQDVVVKTLIAGDSVDIMGFGSFSIRRKDARKMVSFGKEIEVPASKTVSFKAGKTLKDAIN